MTHQPHVIATSRDWNPEMAQNLEKKTGHRFISVLEKDRFTEEELTRINPGYVFIPHWSFIIPEPVYSRFKCIIFHMTDLPFGRGGSPLQNLVSRGIYDTRISAIQCVSGLDQGPVYLKKDLSLHGNAEEIYIRAGRTIEDMIVEIIDTAPTPAAQTGTPTYFPRRTPDQGDISELSRLEEAYDFIRMLDADGYPKAFLETRGFRFEFSRASLKKGRITADVNIRLKK